MELVIILIGWLSLCFVIGLIGAGRKIGFASAFFLSLFLSPLIGAIFTATSPAIETQPEGFDSFKNSTALDLSKISKKCPDCAEEIKVEAKVCRFCGHRYTDEEVKTEVEKATEQFNNNLHKKRQTSENQTAEDKKIEDEANELIEQILASGEKEDQIRKLTQRAKMMNKNRMSISLEEVKMAIHLYDKAAELGDVEAKEKSQKLRYFYGL